MGGFVPPTGLAYAIVMLLTLDRPFQGDSSVPAADADRGRRMLAAKPAILMRSRVSDVKFLEFVGSDAVYLRTDRVVVERMNGEGLYVDGHSPADSIKLMVGGRCRIGGGHSWQNLTLLKIEGKTAVFHRVDNPRRGDHVEEMIAVTPYRAALWLTDPGDRTRYTYNEFDEDGNRRLQKSYCNDRLDGEYTTWDAEGRKQAKYRYKHDWRDGTWTEWHPNGQKRHDVTYRDDSPVGREVWWDANGRESSSREHLGG